MLYPFCVLFQDEATDAIHVQNWNGMRDVREIFINNVLNYDDRCR